MRAWMSFRFMGDGSWRDWHQKTRERRRRQGWQVVQRDEPQKDDAPAVGESAAGGSSISLVVSERALAPFKVGLALLEIGRARDKIKFLYASVKGSDVLRELFLPAQERISSPFFRWHTSGPCPSR
jgi:hypothetical protein